MVPKSYHRFWDSLNGAMVPFEDLLRYLTVELELYGFEVALGSC